jgi:hypothetical protein
MRRRLVVSLTLIAFLCAHALAQTVEYTKRSKNEVREGPGSYYQLLKVLPKGVAIPVVKRDGGWVNFKHGNNAGPVSAWISKNCLVEGKQVDLLRDIRLEWQSPKASPSAVAAAIRGFALRYGKASSTVLDSLLELQTDLFTPDEYDQFEKGSGNDGEARKRKRDPELTKLLGEYETTNASQGACFGIVSRLANQGLVTDRKLVKYVNLIAAALASASPTYEVAYRVYIVKGQEPRAYSIPGGFIVLGEGLIRSCNDEAELAAVIAHEMAHITANHGFREQYERRYRVRMEEAFDELNEELGQKVDSTETDLEEMIQEAYDEVVKPRLQEYEEDADRGAAMLLFAVGYDPMALSSIVVRTGLAIKNHATDWTENPFLHLDFQKRNTELMKFLGAHPGYTGGLRNGERFRVMTQGR